MMPTRRAAVTMLTATAVSSLTTTRARAEPDEAVLYKKIRNATAAKATRLTSATMATVCGWCRHTTSR